MNIIRKSPDKYGLQRVGKHCHRIVKILREYEDEQDAITDVTKLMTGDMTEQDLTGAEVVDAGKLGNRINCLEAALESIRDSLIQAMGSEQLEKVVREAAKRINEILGEGRKEG